MKSSLSIWHLLHSVKSTVKISSIFVAFLENMNFKFNGTYVTRTESTMQNYKGYKYPQKVQQQHEHAILQFICTAKLIHTNKKVY